MTGYITDIQRFCLNDGAGIRTSVFFKGCNMRCAWCHNPETIHDRKDMIFYEKNCINCLKCTEVCPTGAQTSINDLHFFDRQKCVSCGKCAEICYPEAMSVSDKEMRIDQVMFEVLQDKPYYLGSGGGVTLTGGEVLCQVDFATELAKTCKENGISAAIETNLGFPYSHFEKLLDNIDTVMLDVKLFNDDEHKKWTGVSNKAVLENIKKLSERGTKMIVRTPLIPGITDTDENLKAIAEYISKIDGVLFYELLNFNPLGESKYKGLDEKNIFEDARPLSEKRLDEIVAMLSQYGLTVKVA